MGFSKIRLLRNYCTDVRKPFYVTTPIFYVNAAPHIGHLYSAVIADAICRYRRLRIPKTPTYFCTGTDENGIKVQQAAALNGKPVAAYCDEISARYRHLFQAVGLSNTDFVRTTEDRHKSAVAHFWRLLRKRDHIYTAQYSGWYCVSDETFLTDSQLRLDAATGVRYSIESGHPVEWTEEQNYMFRLSARQDDVIYWLKQGGRVRPKKFETILFDMLSEPLPDVSISRPINRVHWAIPVPDDETQTVYVWLDALINYLTSAGFPDDKYKNQWPPNVHVIGKDILKFHGVYWPAFLIAAGLEPPQQLFVHSHWTVNGEKMSKSKQNVVDPENVAKMYTMEGLRYFLLREGVAHSDGNYSDVKAQRILNSELGDTMGNLLSRACAKALNPRQIYPRLHATHLNDILLRLDAARHLQETLQQLEERCEQHYDDNNFYLVVDTVMATLRAANNFFENARPWELKNTNAGNNAANCNSIANGNMDSHINSTATAIENANRLETIIAITMDTLRLCGIILQPILPQLSARLLDKLNVPGDKRLWRHLKYNFTTAKGSTVGGISGDDENDAHTEIALNLPRTLNMDMDAILFRRILLSDEKRSAQNDKDCVATTTIKKQKNPKATKKTKLVQQ